MFVDNLTLDPKSLMSTSEDKPRVRLLLHERDGWMELSISLPWYCQCTRAAGLKSLQGRSRVLGHVQGNSRHHRMDPLR